LSAPMEGIALGSMFCMRFRSILKFAKNLIFESCPGAFARCLAFSPKGEKISLVQKNARRLLLALTHRALCIQCKHADVVRSPLSSVGPARSVVPNVDRNHCVSFCRRARSVAAALVGCAIPTHSRVIRFGAHAVASVSSLCKLNLPGGGGCTLDTYVRAASMSLLFETSRRTHLGSSSKTQRVFMVRQALYPGLRGFDFPSMTTGGTFSCTYKTSGPWWAPDPRYPSTQSRILSSPGG
jgi:hypothetical protein